MGTMYVQTTIFSPSWSNMIKSIAIFLRQMLDEDMELHKVIPENSPFYIFHEEKYIKERHLDDED